MKVTAHATRSGDWWAVEVPEVDGLFTQAKRLDQIPAMVADAVALLEDVDPVSIDVDVRASLANDADDAIDRVLTERSQAEAAAVAAAEGLRAVAHQLVEDERLSLRDAGKLLGVSHQRVAQLLNA